MLLIDNFEKYDALSHNSKVSENPVIDIIFRKVKSAFSTAPEPDDYEQVLDEMKARIR